MRRREFISLLGGAAAWPLAARAQQTPKLTIGYLSTRSPAEAKYVTDAFTQGLNEIGYLPHRSTDDRFAPISRLYLKLLGLPEKCHFET
jgi:putative tryptophan/tyrosine transport system substrate-binding protein